MIHHDHPQGSEDWLAARRGCITGSRFKVCRDYKALTKAQAAEGRTRGDPSSKLLCYAYDTARERCGGQALAPFQNYAMRVGTEQESPARRAYEARTGNLVEEVGFFTTEDGLFGVSPDGLIDDDGVLEIKTMVGSETLFTAVAQGDVSEYMDQCLGYLWLLGRQWVDLVLWVPDLEHMTIRRITRDENAIEALESDLIAFAALVREQEALLRKVIGQEAADREPTPAPTPAPAEPPTATVHQLPPRQLPPSAPPSLRLGQINERLGFTVTADFLDSLGYPVAATEKNAKLYRESDFPSMCMALAHRLQSVAQNHAVAA